MKVAKTEGDWRGKEYFGVEGLPRLTCGRQPSSRAARLDRPSARLPAANSPAESAGSSAESRGILFESCICDFQIARTPIAAI